MTRSEVGVRPLLSNIICRSVAYIQSLDRGDKSLANQALDWETDRYEDNILSLAWKYTPFYHENSSFLEPKDKREVRNIVMQNYDNLRKDKLLSKASSFFIL